MVCLALTKKWEEPEATGEADGRKKVPKWQKKRKGIFILSSSLCCKKKLNSNHKNNLKYNNGQSIRIVSSQPLKESLLVVTITVLTDGKDRYLSHVFNGAQGFIISLFYSRIYRRVSSIFTDIPKKRKKKRKQTQEEGGVEILAYTSPD